MRLEDPCQDLTLMSGRNGQEEISEIIRQNPELLLLLCHDFLAEIYSPQIPLPSFLCVLAGLLCWLVRCGLRPLGEVRGREGEAVLWPLTLGS